MNTLVKDLFIKLALAVWRDPYGADVWRYRKSVNHRTFYLGIGIKPGKQMFMRLTMDRWHDTDFAKVLPELPAFDGHTVKDFPHRFDHYLRMT